MGDCRATSDDAGPDGVAAVDGCELVDGPDAADDDRAAVFGHPTTSTVAICCLSSEHCSFNLMRCFKKFNNLLLRLFLAATKFTF